jgi:ferritin-like metal-binding protein YciE
MNWHSYSGILHLKLKHLFMAKATAKKRSNSSSTSRSKASSSNSRTKSNAGSKKTQSSPTSRGGGSSRSGAKSPTARSGSRSRSSQQQPGALLQKYFLDELKDLYNAEKQQLRSLQKMAKNSTTEELREAFENHRMQTETQIERLDQVFETLGARAQGKKCEAMEGLVKEMETVLEDTQDDTMTRDVALIIGAQKAEHYEIASYGGLAQLARTMGQEEIAELLTESLEEEKEADMLLTQIAENNINMEAEEESGEEEEEGGEEAEESEEEEE